MGLTVAQLFARIGLTGADQTVRGLQQVSNQVDRTGRGMGGLGNASGRLAGGLVRVGAVATGAVATGLVASAKAAIDYESAFAGVRKTVDATEPQLKGLSADFRRMSTEIPISAIRLAQLGETAGALGIGSGSSNPIGAIKEFVRVTALIGETTDVSADQAATSLGQLGNVLALREKDYERFGSTLVDLGNKGASTESQILEIAQRAGGLAHAAGFSAQEVLGWSSAVANLGMNNELAGSSIQRFVGVAIKSVGEGGKGLKLFAKTAGMSSAEFRTAFEKDASGALESFVEGLAKLPVAERAARLKELKLNGIGLTTMFAGLTSNVGNLSTSLDIAGTAWEKNEALAAEAQKRFDTVQSSITVLKNNLVDAAIEIGTGMLPGIKRFTQETVGFIKENRGEINALGADIGKTLDGVDWREVLDGGKTFVSLLKDAAGVSVGILTTLNKLPTEVKAAGLGLLALNKISGGAVGDVVGGIAGSVGGGLVKGVAGRLPGIGSLVATPVRVVNWPAGGLGGAGGVGGAARGGMTKLQKGALGVSLVADLAAVFQTQQQVSGESTAHAASIQDVQRVYLEQNPTTAALHNSLAAVDRGIAEIQSNPLNMLVQGDALTTLHEMRSDLVKQITKTDDLDNAIHRDSGTVRIASEKAAAKTAAAARAAGISAGVAAKNAGDRTVSATRGGLGEVKGRINASIGIERAILAKRRDVSVTIRPLSTSLNVDGRRFASALVKYGPTTIRAL